MGLNSRIGVNTEYLTDLVVNGQTSTKVGLDASHRVKFDC